MSTSTFEDEDQINIFVEICAAGNFFTAIWIVYMIYLSDKRRRLAFQGDEVAAKYIILPCYRPFFIGLVVLYLLMGVGQSLTFILAPTIITQFYIIQYSSLCLLTSFSICPVLLLQSSVSRAAFWRTFYTIAPWFVCCSLLWGLSNKSIASIPLQICFWLLTSLPAVAIGIGVLTKLISSRIQIGSSSNRNSIECMLIYALFFGAANVGSIPSSNNGNKHELVVVSGCLAAFSFIWNQLFPFALQRTLLADTKYWRGLGKHNQGGLKTVADTDAGSKIHSIHRPTMELNVVAGDFQVLGIV